MKSLTLLFLSFVYVFTFVKSFSYQNVKAAVSIDADKFQEAIGEECAQEEETNEYSVKCLNDVTLTNYKQVCPNITSKFCQDFYNDPNPIQYFPVCGKNPIYQNTLTPEILQIIKNIYSAMCQTDEDGDLCPIVAHRLLNANNSKKSPMDSDTATQILNDTCKSKSCTESTIDMFKDVNAETLGTLQNLSVSEGSYSYNELSSLKELVSFLKSDKCQSKQVKSDAANTKYQSKRVKSDAANTKINNILLISLVLLMVRLLH